MVTGSQMSVAVVDQRRLLEGANFGSVAAPRMEAAAGWRRDRTGHIALKDNSAPDSGRIWVRNGHRGQESLGIRMDRALIQFFCRRDLDELAKVHDCDSIRD